MMTTMTTPTTTTTVAASGPLRKAQKHLFWLPISKDINNIFTGSRTQLTMILPIDASDHDDDDDGE